MCGITGFIDSTGRSDDTALRSQVTAMADTLTHRGPDSAGVWIDAAAGVALGHRRLSIVDLSEAGAQPMVSADERFVLTYNGEVYNFPDLRRDLEEASHVFRGHSDTEVLLEGCRRWGVETTVGRLIGMFAFALWDRHERRLVLVRDRLGIKPLYWGRFGPLFLFGSELKALRAHPGWQPVLNRNAIAAYLRYNYVPAPHCVYQQVHKLEPGCILTWRPGGEPDIRRYWRLADAVGKAPPTGNPVEELETLLTDAVSRRMIADVPLGAFLSGGIDSSTVVSLMQLSSNRPVKSFSIGFGDSAYDEAADARAVAEHIGTEHTELTVDAGQSRDVIPDLADFYDEPFADASQIPTYLVSKLTRGHVTVALSGDGGDEVFAGYNRHVWAERIWRGVAPVPAGLRDIVGGLAGAIPVAWWNGLSRCLPSGRRPRQFGEKVHKLAGALRAADADGFCRNLVSHWTPADGLMPGTAEAGTPLSIPPGLSMSDRMRFADTLSYLPDDILTKVDRASMAVGLEARVPLLDHRVVEFAWSLPRDMLVRDGTSKWILRQVLYRHVPRRLIDRPKMGFAVPIDAWLRGPLKDWAEDLLAPDSLAADDLLEPAPIRRAWDDHLSGRLNRQYPIWGVLMLQAWRRRWS